MEKKRFLKNILFLVFFVLFGTFTFAQNKTITGKVTDNNGASLSGATVSVKKGQSTTTNADGTFSFSVPVSVKTISVSYAEFQLKEIDITSTSNVTVSLERLDKGLDDVVVVGYATQKRATVTGAVSEVKGSDLIKSPVSNVSNNLVGRLPGLISTNSSGEPGADGASILIRGLSTFSGSNAPLIVIDGVANRPGGFERLNPNDIEKISILKDASAAIYGAQAANGVILITTKRGKSGITSFSFNINQSFNSFMKVPKMLSSADFATLMYNEPAQYTNQPLVFTEQQLQKFRDGSDPIGYPNTDWYSAIVKPVVGQNRMNLSFKGGTEKMQYYASFGRLKQEGQFKNSDAFSFLQYNASLALDAQVTDNIKLSFDVQYRYEDNRLPPQASAPSPFSSGGGSYASSTIFAGIWQSLPFNNAIFPDGRLGLPTSTSQLISPLAQVNGLAGEGRAISNYVLNTARFKWDLPWITNGLFIDGFVAADINNFLSKDFGKSYELFSYNRNTQAFSNIVQTTSSGGLASLSQANSYSTTVTMNAKLNYNKIFGNHSVNSFLAYEQQRFAEEYSGVERNNFLFTNIQALDYGSPLVAGSYGNGSNTARRNYFGRINYGFKNKYFLELQGRYDGSDKFPENSRFGFFPSVSAGWQLAKEPWFEKNIKFVNGLKLRGSWGLMGNDRISPYQFLQFYSLSGNGYSFDGKVVASLVPGVLPNPNFTWEKAEVYNVALDAELFNRSLSFTIEAFRQKRTSILTQRLATVPVYSGVTLPVENIGSVLNRGIEFSANYKNRISKFNYSFGGNFTYTRNRVLFVDEPQSLPDYQKIVGRPLNTVLFYVADGLFQNQEDINKHAVYQLQTPRPGDVKFVDINGDGKINGNDRKRIDLTNTPEIIYGFNIEVEYLGFDATILLQGQARSKRFFAPQASATLNTYQFMFDGRSTPGNVTDKPTTAGAATQRPGQANGNTHPFFWRNTSFMRVKNVEVGYTFNEKIGRKIGLSSARLYVNAANLLTFAKFNDVDPEMLNRPDGRTYPILRTVNAGLLINF